MNDITRFEDSHYSKNNDYFESWLGGPHHHKKLNLSIKIITHN